MSEVWATESLLQSSLYPEVHTSPLLVSCTPASLLLHLEEEGGDPEPDVEERRDERICVRKPPRDRQNGQAELGRGGGGEESAELAPRRQRTDMWRG